MKEKTVLKSFDNPSREMVEPEPDKPAPGYLELIPASLQEPQHVPLPIRELKHSDWAAYRHWGINE
jgi:hypothetical protein